MKNILAVDRGTKYIGLSYRNERSGMTMPIGEVMNDPSTMFTVGDMITRYHIGSIVIGYPKNHKNLQSRIDDFCKQLTYIERELVIHKVDEEYSSVQAGAVREDFVKGAGEDTIASMFILNNFLEKNKKDTY